jgi:hypothetical protein
MYCGLDIDLNPAMTPIMDTSGIVLNFACVICIGQILWHKSESSVSTTSNMFKYLFVKSACDFVFFFNDIFLYRFYCNGCNLFGTRAGVDWFIYLYIGMGPVLIQMSGLLEKKSRL